MFPLRLMLNQRHRRFFWMTEIELAWAVIGRESRRRDRLSDVVFFQLVATRSVLSRDEVYFHKVLSPSIAIARRRVRAGDVAY